MKRNTTVEYLDDADAADVAELPPALLVALNDELAQQEAKLKHRRAVLVAGMVERYSLGMAQAFKGEPFGTAHMADGHFDVKIEIRKNVSWDQAKLADACRKLDEMGQDATEYVTTEIKVAESKFKAWPASVQKLFEPARTTKPEKPKITLTQREAEAA